MNDRLTKLLQLQEHIRAALLGVMMLEKTEALSRQARDDRGDTIFGIDVAAEQILLQHCEAWGRDECFLLIAEGLEPETGLLFGKSSSGPAFRLIVDPIDGTRGLMYDKRSAWSLAAIAPDKGESTSLADVECAAMTELPTTRQSTVDLFWAERGRGTQGKRVDMTKGVEDLTIAPSTRTDFLHGFATVVNFFQGGKELTSRIEEDLFRMERGGWNPEKAEIYTDQYISTGGVLAELMLGRDRFVMDIRPLVHRALGIESSLCCRPYDLCTALLAEEAGCVVCHPDGSPIDVPLDVTTNVAFVGYANRALADRLQPMVREVLARHGVI